MIAAFSVTPLGGGDSVGDLVAECVRIVRESGLRNETNAMFTNVEGDWEDIQRLVGRCIDHLHEGGVPRVSVVMKMDSRVDHDNAMEHKVQRIELLLTDD